MAFLQAQISSERIGMTTGINVVIPDGKAIKDMPVVYLLHGLSDNYTNWIRRTSVERYADEAHCIVVMPEVQRSFYTDMKYGMEYFSYITNELPAIVERLFGISREPKKTYIAGLSMGGYGALKCGLTYPERYAGVAAFSAVADLQGTIDGNVLSSLGKQEITAIFGEEMKIGEKNDLFALSTRACENAKKAKVPTSALPRIFMSCGTEDELYAMNLGLKAHIEALGFPDYKYVEWEDGHTWRFWDTCIQLAFDFFFDDPE